MCVASDDLRHRDVVAHYGFHKKAQDYPKVTGEDNARSFFESINLYTFLANTFKAKKIRKKTSRLLSKVTKDVLLTSLVP